MATSSPSALLGPVYLLTNGSPAQKEIILPGAESSDRGQPPLPGGEDWTGNRGNSGRGQRQRHIEGSEKTDGARQGLRGAEGGTVWRPSPWTSFSKTPGGSQEVSQEPKVLDAHQHISLNIWWVLIFIEHQNFSPNLSMTEGQAGAQRGSGACPGSHSSQFLT